MVSMLHSMLYTIVDNFNNNFHAVCRLLWTFRLSIIIVISSLVRVRVCVITDYHFVFDFCVEEENFSFHFYLNPI